ncbi:MAG TPA: hypothetical protein VEV83_11515 [Parafilimonas sp.]|nr:hypothetical protein [Parafilimonas sp.]
MKKNLGIPIIAVVMLTAWTNKNAAVISSSKIDNGDTTSLRSPMDTTSLILFKPCPPCCAGSSTNWPDILVSKNFWSKSIDGKKNELQNINTPALARFLGPEIATLESGTDLDRAVNSPADVSSR